MIKAITVRASALMICWFLTGCVGAGYIQPSSESNSKIEIQEASAGDFIFVTTSESQQIAGTVTLSNTEQRFLVIADLTPSSTRVDFDDIESIFRKNSSVKSDKGKRERLVAGSMVLVVMAIFILAGEADNNGAACRVRDTCWSP